MREVGVGDMVYGTNIVSRFLLSKDPKFILILADFEIFASNRTLGYCYNNF